MAEPVLDGLAALAKLQGYSSVSELLEVIGREALLKAGYTPTVDGAAIAAEVERSRKARASKK